jgi:hypothetical protein
MISSIIPLDSQTMKQASHGINESFPQCNSGSREDQGAFDDEIWWNWFIRFIPFSEKKKKQTTVLWDLRVVCVWDVCVFFHSIQVVRTPSTDVRCLPFTFSSLFFWRREKCDWQTVSRLAQDHSEKWDTWSKLILGINKQPHQ